ncbi:hypothetical protein [Coleofasciculus sp. FACHB-1120]|uniref:hypothetical protein n=1 Tax=Coleofasciculus sp. FACHB-1120 TaxID=2692783 RepID=UPI00168816B6|nr:hypothetical protein [Coleofasciculus sp. FACHB-1120]MBD2744581.1 hypothetical protein [Coleofasciculus sp. FACHB-1120]
MDFDFSVPPNPKPLPTMTWTLTWRSLSLRPTSPKNLFLTFPWSRRVRERWQEIGENVNRKGFACDFPVIATYRNTAYHLPKDFVRVKMVAVIAGKTLALWVLFLTIALSRSFSKPCSPWFKEV